MILGNRNHIIQQQQQCGGREMGGQMRLYGSNHNSKHQQNGMGGPNRYNHMHQLGSVSYHPLQHQMPPQPHHHHSAQHQQLHQHQQMNSGGNNNNNSKSFKGRTRPNLPLSSKFKTELCHYLSEQGRCPFGDQCTYAHSPTEIRHIDRHPKHKTLPCRDFSSAGFCPFGERCSFVHHKTDPEDILKMAYKLAAQTTAQKADNQSNIENCQTNASNLQYMLLTVSPPEDSMDKDSRGEKFTFANNNNIGTNSGTLPSPWGDIMHPRVGEEDFSQNHRFGAPLSPYLAPSSQSSRMSLSPSPSSSSRSSMSTTSDNGCLLPRTPISIRSSLSRSSSTSDLSESGGAFSALLWSSSSPRWQSNGVAHSDDHSLGLSLPNVSRRMSTSSSVISNSTAGYASWFSGTSSEELDGRRGDFGSTSAADSSHTNSFQQLQNFTDTESTRPQRLAVFKQLSTARQLQFDYVGDEAVDFSEDVNAGLWDVIDKRSGGSHVDSAMVDDDIDDILQLCHAPFTD